MRAIAKARIKTDKISADILADLVRTDLLPRAYAPSKETRGIKYILRQRMFYVRIQTMVKNRIHNILDHHPWSLSETTGFSDLFGANGMKWLGQLTLPGGDHDLLTSELQLMSLFFSSLILYEIDDVSRFREERKLCSYVGIVPSTCASGGKVFHGRITKREASG